jgi:preprotein translocase subunit SecD
MNPRSGILALLAVAALSLGAFLLVTGPSAKALPSLEETGGSYLIFEVSAENATDENMSAAIEIVSKRMMLFGDIETSIEREGKNAIKVKVPGSILAEDVASLFGRRGRLEFLLVDVRALPDDMLEGIAPPGSKIVPGAIGTDYEGSLFAVRRNGGLRGDSIESTNVTSNPMTEEPEVQVTFGETAANEFALLTEENVGRQLAIVMDDELVTAPIINEPIRGGQVQISGNFTQEEAQKLAIILRSGSLPIDLEYVEVGTFGGNQSDEASGRPEL